MKLRSRSRKSEIQIDDLLPQEVAFGKIELAPVDTYRTRQCRLTDRTRESQRIRDGRDIE